MSDVPVNIRNAGVEAALMYERLLSEGYGHRWAEMCALQQPPGVKGADRSFMQGRYSENWLDDMPKDQAQRITREARAAGINISGKFYASGLADSRAHCDPAAWVDSIGDVKRVAQQRNLSVAGAVDHKPVELPRAKSKPLSDRLIREFSKIESKRHPGKKAGEIREIVIDKYAPKWRKRNA